VFEHALIRDVAYRTIVRPLRAEKHQRAAEWMSSLSGDRRDRADAIAFHYVTAFEYAQASGTSTGELRHEALSALRAAAERAVSIHSHAEAARLWRQAVDLSTPEDGARPHLLLEYGKALAIVDEPAEQILDEAAAALIAAGERSCAAEAESTNGWLLSLAGREDLARARDERALELVRDAPASHAKALILTRAGTHVAWNPTTHAEALRLLAEGLSIAEQLGFRDIQAEALQFVGLTRLDAGELEGIEDCERALAVALELSSPVSLSCYGNLADVRRCLGSLEESARLHAAGERDAVRFGIPVQARRFRAERAIDLYYGGEWDEALSHLDEYLEAVETGLPHRGVGEATLNRARIRLARGDAEGAWDDARAALEFARETGESWNLFPALALHARAAVESAPDLVEASVEEFLASLTTNQPFWGAASLPDLLAAAGAEHQAALRPLLDAASPPSRWYDAARAVIDGDLVRAADIYAEIGSQPDEAVARLEAAKLSPAGRDDELERAIAFFRSVGAHAYLREAAPYSTR
jgi:tetratricopeptide (TPR) repeat protein